MAGESGMVARLEIRRREIGVYAPPGEYFIQQASSSTTQRLKRNLLRCQGIYSIEFCADDVCQF